MKAIRRSLKSDKERESRHQTSNSLHQKSATAIIPPKRVIKALYDYEPASKNGQELAFHKGDFFHVVSREDDSEWYEACNPLIPSARGLVPVAFFEVIGKSQRQSGQSTSTSDGAHDSGFSERGISTSSDKIDVPPTPRSVMHQRGGSTARANAMVYGIVQYDFHAERPDELDAKAGEPIIVVAQSNPEWFVAKPIGRLGGPGLIPVSFIDIKDTATGNSVTDPLDAVRAAGVPRVEEWKRTAAEYKNSSISLGQLNAPASQQPQPVNNLTQSMERVSLQTQQKQNNMGPPPPVQAPNGNSNMPLAPLSASVPRYCFDNDMYWYIIEAQMEDGRWWELSRYYADFYDFQIALLEAFPEEAGNRGKQRSLPFMPGPVAHVTDAISNGRRQNLDEYIKKIIAMPPHISKSILVRKLFQPKPNQDYEIDPNALNDDYRLSGQSLAQVQSRQSSGAGSHQTPHSGYARSTHSSTQHNPRPSYGGQNGGMQAPPLHTQASTLTTNSTGTQNSRGPSSGANGGANANAGAGGQLKFKVHLNGDLIAMRLPGDADFAAVKDKIMERLKVNDNIVIKYETGSGHAAIHNDADLDACISVNPSPKFFVEFLP